MKDTEDWAGIVSAVLLGLAAIVKAFEWLGSYLQKKSDNEKVSIREMQKELDQIKELLALSEKQESICHNKTQTLRYEIEALKLSWKSAVVLLRKRHAGDLDTLDILDFIEDNFNTTPST